MAGEKSDNLDLWDSVEDIDPKFTKPITGKDYSGTSPNPTYLVKLATEKLGPAGQGFGWEVIADGFQPLGETILHYCRIRFWWGADRANSFEAYGQTKASYPTKSGFHKVDEDAPKKSLTDAITKALSQLGFASGIFMGRWDDSKYVAEVNAEYRRAENGGKETMSRKEAGKHWIKANDASEFARKIIAHMGEAGALAVPVILKVNAKGLANLKNDSPALYEQVEAKATELGVTLRDTDPAKTLAGG